MLSSITPLGERGRGRAFAPTATAYALGSVGGAALLGFALGALGSALPDSWRLGRPIGWLVVAGAAAVGVLLDLRIGGLALPTIRRQVNENWLSTYRGVVTGVGFGFQLGLGVVTIVTSSLVYLTWFVALLSGRPSVGLFVGLAFGAARSMPVLGMYRVHRPDQLASAHRRVASWSTSAHRGALGFAVGAALVAVSAGAAA